MHLYFCAVPPQEQQGIVAGDVGEEVVLVEMSVDIVVDVVVVWVEMCMGIPSRMESLRSTH